MPEKDGDEGKSTKSVVNKKQKQMMGEEGYDIARDMGRVRPSKDKKDATTMSPSKEMKKTQKVNKGPSAFERVKARYGKSVMKVEELDLTKVAEAFGGHIVEANGDKSTFSDRKKNPEPLKKVVKQARRARPDLFGDPDATLTNRGRKIDKKQTTSDAPATDFDKAATNLSAFSRRVSGEITGDDLDKEILARRRQETRRKKDVQQIINPNRRFFTDKPDRETLRTPKTDNEGQFLDKEGKPEPKKLKPATRRKSTATPPAFATRTGESGGPLPVSMRNRRVPKTSSLSPNVKVTSIVKPKVGALTQTDFNKIVPFRRGTKTYNDFINPEVVDPGGPKPEKGGEIGKDTGRTVDTTVIKPDVLKLKPPKIAGYLAPGKTKADKPDPPEEPGVTPVGGDGGKGKGKTRVGTATPGKGPFSRVRAFARRNPALSLIGYDALKNLKVPSVTKPTKTGRVSAGT